MLYVEDDKNIYALGDETYTWNFFFALFYYLHRYSIVNLFTLQTKTIFYTKSIGRIRKKVQNNIFEKIFFCLLLYK